MVWEPRQNSVTPQLLLTTRWKFSEEGDLLLTGTPAGVGPVQAGDSIAIGIEELGSSAVFDVQ